MSNGNGHSWSKFSWRDWSADKALHPCSLAARGFWIEMLCIMHEGCPIGHLTMGGKPATTRQMAANAYCSEKEATKHLAELEAAGVFSRTTDGTIYSRRMVKDAAISAEGAKHIAKRWGDGKSSPDPNRGANRSPTSQPTREPTSHPSRDPITKNLELEKEKETSSFSLKQDSVSPPAREEAPSEAAVRAARQQSAAEVSAMPAAMAEAVRSASAAMRNYALDGQGARQTINEQREDVATRTPPRSAYLSREQLQAARRQQLRVVA